MTSPKLQLTFLEGARFPSSKNRAHSSTPFLRGETFFWATVQRSTYQFLYRISLLHLVMDNYSTHKSQVVQQWLKPKKRRRFHFHFTPTSSSWLNQVERFFALITDRMIRRGTFLCVGELERAIYQWMSNWNNEPQPFVWKATADVILDKVRRCKEAIAKN